MKISNIRSELDAAATVHNNHSTLAPLANCFQPSSSLGFFSNFELLSKDSVKKLVLGVPTKSCSLDSVPTKVVKECLDELVPLLTVIIIHQTHYEKSDWSRAFNQFTIACELDMINVLSAADNTFIMSSSTSAWLLSPLECSPQKQNG